MPVIGSASAFLPQSVAGAGTAVQAAPAGGVLGVIAMIAIAVIGLTLVALVATLVPTLLGLRKAALKMEKLLDRVGAEMDPIVDHAKNVADNADYISTAVRADVGEVRNTIRRANDGLGAAVDATEQRVRELGALLRVFQDEVEQTFISGSSMLRGFRAGAGALRHDAADLLDELEEYDEEEELEDDDEYFHESDGEDDEELIDEPGTLQASGMKLDVDDADGEIDDTFEDGEESDDGYQWTRDGGDGGDGPEARPRIRHRPS